MPHRICFVCLGNICRSPTAEGVMRHLLAERGLQGQYVIDSAGTGAWHAGERPDSRSAGTARRRGIDLVGRARAFLAADFERFDLVVAMDRSNLDRLRAMAPDREARSKTCLLRDFDPTAAPGSEVPDPYYGGPRGFDDVLDICIRGCEGLLEQLENESVENENESEGENENEGAPG